MFKKFILLFLTVIILVSCAKNSTKIIRVAHNQSIEHPIHIALLEFKKQVEQQTKNRLTIQLFPNELLGGQRETVELTQTGAIDLTVASISLLETFNKSYSVFNLPYLFNSREHYHLVMSDNSIMNDIYESTKNSGFVGITWFDVGSRNFYVSSKPILTPKDLSGKKIRVQQSQTNIKMIKAFGAAATPMSYGEVYTALQQGVIDGAENNELALTNNKHGEVSKHYSYNQHAMIPDILVASNKLLHTLNEDDLKIVLNSAKNITNFEIKEWDKLVKVAKNEAIKMGVQFYYPDIEPFKQLVEPIHAELTKDSIVKITYDKIQTKIKEN